MISGSSDGFFSKGFTMALLNNCGKIDDSSDKFTILVIAGSRMSMWYLRIHVGIGSRLQCLDGEDMTNLRISSSVVGWKNSRTGTSTLGHKQDCEVASFVEAARMFSIFEIKNLLKVFAKSLWDLWDGNLDFPFWWSSDCTMMNSSLELAQFNNLIM